MSDEEEESLSEGFSASEDDWKPSKQHDGASSDDDDSDFEQEPVAVAAVSASRKRESKARSAGKKSAGIKKRKPAGQSLRAKMYKQYRPPPQTFHTSGSNSPRASTSQTASKNARTPNESGEALDDSSSDSSIDNYLVNPANLDLKSGFFNVGEKANATKTTVESNALPANLSDSDAEGDAEPKESTANAFDFRNLLEKANSLERAKETIAKRTAAAAEKKAHAQLKTRTQSSQAMDVKSLLALGEKQNKVKRKESDAEEEDEEEEEEIERGPHKLNKTKSTRIKRHTKTRPASTVITVDTDDSEWEEVADDDDDAVASGAPKGASNKANANLEIHVDLPSRERNKKTKKQQDIELAFKRKLNRDLKERQLLLHKTSLLCLFARSYFYNRLLNDTTLMNAALKLLPSKNAYPAEHGTEVKYFLSLAAWFKTLIKLQNPKLYPDQISKKKSNVKKSLAEELKKKEARSKQDMVFLFVILTRGMGLQCRLVVNMQPLPLKPAQSDLLSIKLKPDDKNKGSKGENKDKNKIPSKKGEGGKNVEKHATLNSSGESKENRKIKKSDAATKKDKDGKEKRTEMREETEVEVKPQRSIRSRKRKADGEDSTAEPMLSKKKAHDQKEKNPPLKPKETKKAANEQATSKVNINCRETRQNKRNVVPAITIDHAAADEPQTSASLTKKTIKRSNSSDSSGRSRSTSPKICISPKFLQESKPFKENLSADIEKAMKNVAKSKQTQSKKKNDAVKISPEFLKNDPPKRVLRSRIKSNETNDVAATLSTLKVPQLDGGDDIEIAAALKTSSAKYGKERSRSTSRNRPQLEKLKKTNSKEESDEDFEPSPSKRPKRAPVMPKVVQKLRKDRDRRVMSTDEEEVGGVNKKRHDTLKADFWVEIWADVEQKWVCLDLFNGKVDDIDSIRKSASPNLAYVYAYQNDLTIKDVTARYCPNWSTTVRKSRVEKSWLDHAIAPYYAIRTLRDIREDQELRHIHEMKPLPTTINEFKDHPLYALERHLLKFQGIYPPDAPSLGFIRGEPIYSRDCVHLLHSREIWLKQARVVKLGEQPYKIVKARPKWDRHTQTVIKDQPLEIFGYWQTQEYDPPTAENGIVPRNAYGNVELFKECMLPKKCVHLRLSGLNRICKKLNIDCANAVIGFDFHQGACHPVYDGFVICEEFAETVRLAWEEDQETQERKEQEKYEARVYGNWKKLVKGLLIRERLKRKYNF